MAINDLSKYAPKYRGLNGRIFDGIYEKFSALADDVAALLADGLQLSDFFKLGDIVPTAYDAIKDSGLLVGDPEKDDSMLTEFIRYLYWCLDPNIKWLPNWLEDKIEKHLICDLLIPALVRTARTAVSGYKAHVDEKGSATTLK